MTVLILILVLIPSLVVVCYPAFIRYLVAVQGQLRHPDWGGKSTDPTVSIIVPCCGLESNQREKIEALLGQKIPGLAEILFCVESSEDPVVAVLDLILKTRSDAKGRVIVTGLATENLGKMHNLIGGYAETVGDRLILLDSDVQLPDPSYLRRFLTGLDRPGVGLVSCFPAYRDFSNISAAIMGLTINNDLLGLFAVVGAHGELSLANGSCMAVDRTALEAGGGLGVLRRQLLMDTALARNILEAGYDVHLHCEAAPVLAGPMTWQQMRQQSRRWHLAMWRVLPRTTYIGFAWLRSGFLLATAACVFSGFMPALVAGMALSLVTRTLVSFWLDRHYMQSSSFHRYSWLLPLVELLNGWDALTAPLGQNIQWRGRSYRLDARGQAVGKDSFGTAGPEEIL